MTIEQCTFVLQGGPGVAVWAAGSNHAQVGYTTLTQSGKLIVYKSNGDVRWQSGSSGPAQKLIVKEDGALDIIGEDGNIIWTSGLF